MKLADLWARGSGCSALSFPAGPVRAGLSIGRKEQVVRSHEARVEHGTGARGDLTFTRVEAGRSSS